MDTGDFEPLMGIGGVQGIFWGYVGDMVGQWKRKWKLLCKVLGDVAPLRNLGSPKCCNPQITGSMR